MKLLHLADLHIGKRVNEFSMIEEQKYILEQIIRIIEEEVPDGILLAGDIYDKSQPSTTAVEVLDEFFTRLSAMGKPVFVISGNHDSPERLSFGNRLLEKSGLYIAGVYEGGLQKVSLQDEHGKVNVYLMPFLKPAMVRPYFENQMESYEEAIRMVLEKEDVNIQERNVLVAHQFVLCGTGQPERSESEQISVGGLDHVDASVFDSFDYVALGHLHRPQQIGRETIRYAGSPLKYSFSEAHHVKSVTLIDLGKKGEIRLDQRPLFPLHDLREIKGPLEELLRIGREDEEGKQDYIHATLTDEEEIYDAIGQIRQVYPNLMVLDFEHRSRMGEINSLGPQEEDIGKKSPVELFADFYSMQNGQEITPKQLEIVERILEQAGGGGR